MGQKAHPYGLRLGYIKPWRARWFARRGFAASLHEDLKIRDQIKKSLGFAGIANVEIERSSGRVRVRIYTARPGVIIGRRGQEIDKIKEELSRLTQNELFLDIKEVKNPQTDAQLVAENISTQLEKRIGFRRAMKKAVQLAMSKGALGIKVICKGRLGGSEIARDEGYREGKVPLSTFRADIDYGFSEAHTTYGAIGCKVWIYKGDILVKKEDADRRAQLQAALLAAVPVDESAMQETEDKKEEKKPKTAGVRGRKPVKKAVKESQPKQEKTHGTEAKSPE
ncbi:MAG: 30S ribosomal protein S3 [Omnitrophica bacterium GWA2_52_8]|nr:MAG: 30S ribosomal protein S3 [Omnitrophica bacterium GWA2_52_8]